MMRSSSKFKKTVVILGTFFGVTLMIKLDFSLVDLLEKVSTSPEYRENKIREFKILTGQQDDKIQEAPQRLQGELKEQDDKIQEVPQRLQGELKESEPHVRDFLDNNLFFRGDSSLKFHSLIKGEFDRTTTQSEKRIYELLIKKNKIYNKKLSSRKDYYEKIDMEEQLTFLSEQLEKSSKEEYPNPNFKVQDPNFIKKVLGKYIEVEEREGKKYINVKVSFGRTNGSVESTHIKFNYEDFDCESIIFKRSLSNGVVDEYIGCGSIDLVQYKEINVGSRIEYLEYREKYKDYINYLDNGKVFAKVEYSIYKVIRRYYGEDGQIEKIYLFDRKREEKPYAKFYFDGKNFVAEGVPDEEYYSVYLYITNLLLLKEKAQREVVFFYDIHKRVRKKIIFHNDPFFLNLIISFDEDGNVKKKAKYAPNPEPSAAESYGYIGLEGEYLSEYKVFRRGACGVALILMNYYNEESQLLYLRLNSGASHLGFGILYDLKTKKRLHRLYSVDEHFNYVALGEAEKVERYVGYITTMEKALEEEVLRISGNHDSCI